MSNRSTVHSRSERGAITIMVCLMLLSLLTVAAIGMSKNSLREVIIQATTRQGADVRHLADAGIEWSLYWVSPAPERPNPTGAAATLQTTLSSLAADTTQQGVPAKLSPTGSMIMETNPDYTKSFSLTVMRMGKLKDMPMVSQGQVAVQMLPDIWSIRSDASLNYTSGSIQFIHARETWFTLPAQGSVQ